MYNPLSADVFHGSPWGVHVKINAKEKLFLPFLPYLIDTN